jgi:hypothetical protein
VAFASLPPKLAALLHQAPTQLHSTSTAQPIWPGAETPFMLGVSGCASQYLAHAEGLVGAHLACSSAFLAKCVAVAKWPRRARCCALSSQASWAVRGCSHEVPEAASAPLPSWVVEATSCAAASSGVHLSSAVAGSAVPPAAQMHRQLQSCYGLDCLVACRLWARPGEACVSQHCCCAQKHREIVQVHGQHQRHGKRCSKQQQPTKGRVQQHLGKGSSPHPTKQSSQQPPLCTAPGLHPHMIDTTTNRTGVHS